MKFKNLLLNLSKEDIASLISLQDKIMIKKLEIENLIKIGGVYKIMGINVEFDTSMIISGVKNNVIYIDIKDFNISKKVFGSPLAKGTITFFTKSINDIDGMNLSNNLLTIDVNKFIKGYFNNTYGMNLKQLEINSLNNNKGYFEFGVDILELNLNSIRK